MPSREGDCLAGSILVEEAGGRVSHYDGTPLGLQPETILVSNGPLHAQMLEVVRESLLLPLPPRGRGLG